MEYWVPGLFLNQTSFFSSVKMEDNTFYRVILELGEVIDKSALTRGYLLSLRLLFGSPEEIKMTLQAKLIGHQMSELEGLCQGLPLQ